MFLSCLGAVWSTLVMVFNTTAALLSSLHAALPWDAELALLVAAAARLTRLRRADAAAADAAFSPAGGAAAKYVAHRGAALDAPENTMQAFKYCVNRGCNFVEFDVRVTSDGECVLIHDAALSRICQTSVDVAAAKWDAIKDIDIGTMHPLKDRFKESKPVRLDEAVDYLLRHNVHMLIDVKSRDARIADKLVAAFRGRPELYTKAVVTSFNPLFIYQVRRADPKIVGALAFRPYGFSAVSYGADEGPGQLRFPHNKLLHLCMRAMDVLYAVLWNSTLVTSWCGVSALLIHKDYISQYSVSKWRRRGYHVLAWTANHPAEKNYLHRVAGVTYLTDTLVGELRPEKTRGDRNGAGSEDDPLKVYPVGDTGSGHNCDAPSRDSSNQIKFTEFDNGDTKKSKLTNGSVETVDSSDKI